MDPITLSLIAVAGVAVVYFRTTASGGVSSITAGTNSGNVEVGNQVPTSPSAPMAGAGGVPVVALESNAMSPGGPQLRPPTPVQSRSFLLPANEYLSRAPRTTISTARAARFYVA